MGRRGLDRDKMEARGGRREERGGQVIVVMVVVMVVVLRGPVPWGCAMLMLMLLEV